jgi:hypothetical protein
VLGEKVRETLSVRTVVSIRLPYKRAADAHNTVHSLERHTLLCAADLCKDSAAVHRNGRVLAIPDRLHQLAARTEHDDALVARVGDDEVVISGARDALWSPQHTDTDVADERAVDAEHAHAVVERLGDGDVTAVGREAQRTGSVKLSVAAAATAEAVKEGAVIPGEHRHTAVTDLGHDDDVGVGTHLQTTVEGSRTWLLRVSSKF